MDAYFTNAKTLPQNNFLLESLQFLYQENDQSRWQKVRVFCCNLYNTMERTIFKMSNLMVFRTTVRFFTYKPQPFHISLHFVSNSYSVLNFGQISYKSFFCRPKLSLKLKLSLKIAQLKFSYFAKIPPWLEMAGRKNQPHAKG